MKTITAALQANLDSLAPKVAICWHITANNGVEMRGTNHDDNLTITASSFAATDLTGEYLSTVAISSSDIRAGDDMSVDNLEVDGGTNDAAGDISVAAIESGILDNARVVVFLVDWSDPDAGQAILRTGLLGQFTRDTDGRYKTEVRGLSQLLQNVIGWVYSERCNVVEFGDSRCGINVSTISSAAVVSSVTNRRIMAATLTSPELLPATLTHGGVVTFTSTNNSGFSREVKSVSVAGSTITLELYEETPEDVVVGDEFTFKPGCDRNYSTCVAYSNVENFRGYGLYIPGSDAILRGAIL